MAWKTKFDNAPTNSRSKAVRPMVHGDYRSSRRLSASWRLQWAASRPPAYSFVANDPARPFALACTCHFFCSYPQADAASKSNGDQQ